MRPRFAVPTLLAALVAVAIPSAAAAHPIHDRGLTIAVTPNPINSGDDVLIYGKLVGPDAGGQTITLYHRVNPQVGYSVVSRTTTSDTGFYDFPRADGVVLTNREWFVRGPGISHSRTVHEKVSALVDLSSSVSSTDTNTPVTFTGSVSPNHPGERVKLQVPSVHGNGWHTFATAVTNAQSQFTATQRWARPGIRTVRALLPRDPRNIASESDSLTISVQQAQVPGFTIASNAPIITEGQTVTISGVLDEAGTNVVEPNAEVTLLGREHGGPVRSIATTTTLSDGSYSFAPQQPTQNTAYRVVTSAAPHRSSAALYEGVADVITMSANPTTVAIGAPVTFTGSVTPSEAGEVVYLQRQNANGGWNNVGAHLLGANGSYAFARVFANPGTREFRTRVFANGINVGNAATPVTITVTDDVAAPSTLPPAM